MRRRSAFAGHEADRAESWTLLEEQYPIGSVIRGRFATYRLRHLRRRAGRHRRPGARERHLLDPAHQAPGDLYKKGDEVEAVVLNIDVENERFSLGIKQLHPDPWTELPTKYRSEAG